MSASSRTLLVLTLLVACSRKTEPSPLPHVQTIADFELTLRLESCYAGVRCVGVTDNQRVRCEVEARMPSPYAPVISLPGDGHVRLDPEAAYRCLVLLREGCGGGLPSVCRDAYVGDIPLDKLCAYSLQCEGDAYCNAAVAGTCRERLPEGASCENADECSSQGDEAAVCTAPDAVDLDASVPDDTRRCYSSLVVPDQTIGQRCGAWLDGGELYQATCDHESYCEDGVCAARPEIGEECFPRPCRDGAMCVRPPFTLYSGTCRPVVVQRTVGGSCEYDPDAFVDCAAPSLACTGYRRCERIGDGSEGAACDEFLRPDLACDKGLTCSIGRCRR